MSASKQVNLDGWFGAVADASGHPGLERTQGGYRSHCPFCAAELKEGVGSGENPEWDAVTVAEQDRAMVESIKRQILFHLSHAPEVFPDEIPGPGNCVGRAFASLVTRGVLRRLYGPENERPSRKSGCKGRRISRYVLIEKEAEADGREGSEATGRAD